GSGADEDVHRRQIAVERLSAMQLPEHVEDARNLAPHRRFGPPFAAAPQERAEIAVFSVFQDEKVVEASAFANQRKCIEHPGRAFTYQPSVITPTPSHASAVPRFAAVAIDASVIPV